MQEQHSDRAIILSLPDDVPRPLWSVMIPTFNCAGYLRQTLASVLAQDLGPERMQIVVVDDCSTKDDPRAVVEELGQGRVEFYQQPQNVGHTKNFETCLQKSRGELVHLLHGDDYVREGFYSKMQQSFAEKPAIGAAFCRHIFVDEHSNWQNISVLERPESGILDNWLETIAIEQRIQTPSIVVKRKVYEKLGGFDHRLSCCEDWEMWIRIATYYPVWFEAEPLAMYRVHSVSNTGRSIRIGENVRATYRAIEIFQSYLPESLAQKLSNQAKKNWAFYILEFAHQHFKRGNRAIAFTQVRETLKFYSSVSFLLKAALFLALDEVRYGRRANA